MHKSLLISTLSLVTLLVLSGCGNSEDNSSIKVDTPSDYATKSAVNYNDNKYGLISAATAAKLVTDWENNKPAGKRKLFIMQYGNIYGFEGTHTEMSPKGTMEVGNGYLKSNKAKGVYVFDRTSSCTSTGDARGDGVSSIAKPVFKIDQIDQAFSFYGIDPHQDVIMLTLGSPNQSKAGSYIAGVARMWYTLSYWGFPQESLMMLNGQASNVLNPDVNQEIADLGITRDDIFTTLPSTPEQNLTKGTDWESLSTVKLDRTILQATMEDMINLVKNPSDSNMILDARSAAEYEGTKKSATEYKVCGLTQDQQCYTAFGGHIKGASNIFFTNVIKTNDGTSDINDDNVTDYKDATFSWKALSEIETEFANAGYNAGDTVYTYCRTGTKASLLTFTSAAILGYKTRMYDGSWIQWGKMANMTDAQGNILVPDGNKWLTDAYSESVVYESNTSLVSPLNKALLNLDANSSDKMILEDKASKQ